MTAVLEGQVALADAPAPWDRRRPTWQRGRLACGLRLAVAPTAFPVARLRLVFPAGAEREPSGLEGLTSLATPLLRAGTARRDAGGLAAAAASLGADLVSGYDWETGSLTLDVLVEDLDEALDLLFEAALAPTFPPEACERMARKRRFQLRQRLEQPPALAADAFARAVYGDDRYGRSLSGTPEGLAAIGPASLARFHRAHCALDRAALVVVGGVDGETVARRVEAALERAPARSAATAGFPVRGGEALARNGREIRFYDAPGASQVDLQIGHRGVAQGDPDLVGLQVVNAVLAGGPLGRLTRDLRRRGIAYFVHSRFVARRGPGPFFIATTVRPDQAARAVAVAFDALRRLCDEPIAADELTAARRWLAAALRQSFEAPADVADRLTHLEAFDLPDDHYAQALAEACALGSEALLALARRHLAPERAVVVAVGPARVVARPLARFGPLVEDLATAVDRPLRGPRRSRFPAPQGAVRPRFPIPEERR